MFTVSLSLPDLCEGADFPDADPTPLDAVEAFLAAVTGSPDQWVYLVKDEKTGQLYHVDMAGGPAVIPAAAA